VIAAEQQQQKQKHKPSVVRTEELKQKIQTFLTEYYRDMITPGLDLRPADPHPYDPCELADDFELTVINERTGVRVTISEVVLGEFTSFHSFQKVLYSKQVYCEECDEWVDDCLAEVLAIEVEHFERTETGWRHNVGCSGRPGIWPNCEDTDPEDHEDEDEDHE